MWVVPSIFALVALSMPVQVYIAETVSEPYPGLFQPAFRTVPEQDGRAFRYRDIELKVDGRTVDDAVLFPGLNFGKRQQLLFAMFPGEGGSAAVDDDTRARFRSILDDQVKADPQTLTVTWQRLRFDPETRKTRVVRTLSEYRVDLTGGDR